MSFLKRLLNNKDKNCILAKANIKTNKQHAITPIRVIKTCNQCHKVCIVKNDETNCPLCGSVDGLKQVVKS